MLSMKKDVMNDAWLNFWEEIHVSSSHSKIFEIDFYTVKVEDLSFSSAYEIIFTKNDVFTGLISWFDVSFDKGLSHKVTFTTNPSDDFTHWLQVGFISQESFNVEKGKIYN